MAIKQAKKASSFIHSVRVNTHVGGDYYAYRDTAKVVSTLKDIGILHVREGGRNFTANKQFGLAGIKMLYLTNPFNDAIVPNDTYLCTMEQGGASVENNFVAPMYPAELISILGEANLDGLEAVNEVDLNIWKYKVSRTDRTPINGDASSYASWINFIDKYNKDLKASISVYPNLSCVAGALGGTYTYNGKNPMLPVPAGIVGNGHYYTLEGGNGFNGKEGYIGINPYYAQVAFTGNLEGRDLTSSDINASDEGNSALLQACYEQPFKNGSPFWVTECGVHTGWDQRSMTYTSHAKALPRLFVENFRLGFEASYWYELIDQDSLADGQGGRENSFGLVKSDYSYKPGTVQLKALIAALGSPTDTRAAADSLDYSLSYVMPSDYTRSSLVKDVLVQKADGTFVLMVYHNVGIAITADGVRSTDLTHPNVAATLTLPKGYNIKNTTLRTDMVAPTATSVTNVTSYAFNVNDTVTILELTPYVAPAPAPAPTPTPTPTTTTTITDMGYSISKIGDSMTADLDVYLKASGWDIWDNADAGGFYYKLASSKVSNTVIAKVESITGGTEAWAKGGIMLRETLDANSKAICIVTTKANGTSVQARGSKGGYTGSSASDGAVSLPVFLKAVRNGTNLTLSYSKDGVTYKDLHKVTNFDFAENYLIGLAATAHNNAQVTTTKFTALSL